MAAPMEPSPQSNTNSHLIDELETAFHNCISLLTSQEHFNVQDSEDTKTSVESAMVKFMEASRQTEAFFLKKKLAVSFQKPEQYITDDIGDLKAELARKDQVIEKHLERLKRCQLMLQSNTGGAGGGVQPQPHPPQHPAPPQPQAPPTQHMGMGPGPLPQYTPHPMQQMPQQAGMGHFQGPGQAYQPPMHTPPMQTPPMQPQPHPMGMPRQQPPSYPQGPLAYLEQTTSNIGLPDRR